MILPWQILICWRKSGFHTFLHQILIKISWNSITSRFIFGKTGSCLPVLHTFYSKKADFEAFFNLIFLLRLQIRICMLFITQIPIYGIFTFKHLFVVSKEFYIIVKYNLLAFFNNNVLSFILFPFIYEIRIQNKSGRFNPS